MTRWRTIAMVLVVGITGCVHARTVATPAPSALPAVQVDTSGVPFAPAPEGLLRPQAIQSIQARLRAHGLLDAQQMSGQLDAPTRQALHRFQEKEDLPATGLPSYRTVEALKLQLDEIFLTAAIPTRGPPSVRR